MPEKIEERLHFLEESKDSHYGLVEKITSPLDPLDIYALAVLKRSISLVYGFIALIRERNFICAAPLIRLQIDNLLRFRAAFMVTDTEKFVVDVFGGKQVRTLKDKKNQKMTDAYLQKELSSDYPWLEDVYKHTSGYIHFSEKHFLNTVDSLNVSDGTFTSYIGPDDKLITSDVYLEAIENMIRVTYEILTFLLNWVEKQRRVA